MSNGARQVVPDSMPGGSASRVLNVPFDLISMGEALERIIAWKDSDLGRFVMIANPHSVMLCRRDRDMMAAAEAATLVLPDGIGIILAARILGYPHGGRVTGPELMLHLCDKGREHGLRHFFYGGADGVAEILSAKLSARFPGLRIAGTYCPPFRPLSVEEEHEIRRLLNLARPDILWVGLGAPKQEKWIASNLSYLEIPAVIGVGAAFDFHSGNMPWASAWLRKFGLEWLHRLVMNPPRMIHRNIDSGRFLAGVFRQRLAARGQARQKNASLPDRRQKT